MKTISKEMRKRQKHFPWLKIFIKEFLKTYPSCQKALQCLVENIEKEVKEIRKGHKQKTKVLFETVNDLYLHFWWKIHWKQNKQWKSYSNLDTTHSYQCSEIRKWLGKVLNFLIYLGIVLSKGASNSLWINRVLQAINILPVNDEIVYDSLLQLHALKKIYRSSYMEILRHILCSEIILNISEPAVYVKSLMLFRRLKSYIEDEVAKASLLSSASRIKPPPNLESWLSSLKISFDPNKSIVDQLFKKSSKKVFQELYNVLFDFENSGSNNKEMNLKFKKKSDSNELRHEKDEESLLRVAVGVIDTPNKETKCNAQSFEKINIDGRNNQIKKFLHLSELCSKIKNSKKKKHVTNKNIINPEIKIKPKLQHMNIKTGNLIESSMNSQNSSTKPKKLKKKRKPKARNGVTDAAVSNMNNITKSKETSKNETSGSKSKKSKKKKKPRQINNSANVIPHNKKNAVNDLDTHSNKAHSSNDDNSVLVHSKFHAEGSRLFKDVNDSSLSENNLMENEEKNKYDENSTIRKEGLTHSTVDNQIFKTDEERHVCVEKPKNKISNGNDLRGKLPNLLANYEIYSSAEENETVKMGISSCPLVKSGDNILVPDTCQNDFNSIVPFNLDSWVPNKDDTSISNNGSLSSDNHPYDSLIDVKKTNMYQNNKSDNSNSSFNDSTSNYRSDSEKSRDTDGSQFSNRYPYVSLIDIRKNKKGSLYQSFDYSNSSFDDSVGIINDSGVSQDTCISLGETQISDKNPFVSLIDIQKMENRNLFQNSGCSNSSYDSSFVKTINGSEISQDTCISNVESQIPDKNLNDIKNVDKIADQHDSNYDAILRNVNSKKINDKSPNISNENHCEKSENKDFESPPDETLLQSKQFQKSLSPCKKLSETLLVEQNRVNTNFEAKMNSPTKRQKKQTNYMRKKSKINYNCDNNKSLVPPKNGKRQEMETSTNDANGDMYLNGMSTFPNLGDLETLNNETISHSTNIALNHSDTQDFSQFQEQNALHEESKSLSHELNRRQSASHTFLEDAEELPLPNEKCQKDVSTYPIETVIDEFIESELSQVHGSCNNLISARLSNNVTETPVGSVHSVSENAYNSFQTSSDLIHSDCFSYKSNLSTPQQNNNQNNLLSVSSSSTTGKRSVENDVAQSLLNLSVNENSQKIAFATNSGHSQENANVIKTNLNSGNSTFVVDCNIIDDFDSKISSRAGSSVGGDTTTIKVILNLINSKKENSLNPNSSGNGFLATCNSSQGLHSSVASGQVMNNSNFSFPNRNNNYFSEPPFFSRTVNELDTPPDSESHLIPSLPRVKNMVSPYSNDKTNFISFKSKGRSSTPKILSRKRHRNRYSHSSESANEWQCDLNSSFSNIASLQRLHCEDVLNTLNVHRNGNNDSVKGNQNKESVSETVENSASTGEKSAFYNPRHLVPYRNSCTNIYTDESENDLSVSTLDILSNEETDLSLIKTTDNDISPKSPLYKEKSSSKVKTKSYEEKQEINASTDHSLIKFTDNKVSPKTPLHRKQTNATKIHTKKLFREEKWALDTPTGGKRKASVVVQPTAQKKKRIRKGIKTAEKPKTTIKRDYNLRLRSLITPPQKLGLYYT